MQYRARDGWPLGVSIMADHNGNANGAWKTVVISGLWAILLLIAAWALADSSAARREFREADASLRQEVSETKQKAAVLEEALKNQREQLQRIEAGVDELRKEQRRQK